MSDGYKLAKLIRQAAQPAPNDIVDLIVGEITSVSPISVKIENREIPEEFLVVGAMCKETHVKWDRFTVLAHTHTNTAFSTNAETSHVHSYYDSTGSGSSTRSTDPTSHLHSIPEKVSEPANTIIEDVLLWRGLQVGDKVLMIKLSRGQRYFILQRLEGLVDY